MFCGCGPNFEATDDSFTVDRTIGALRSTSNHCLWSHLIPNMAVLLYASTTPQHCTGNCLGVCGVDPQSARAVCREPFSINHTRACTRTWTSSSLGTGVNWDWEQLIPSKRIYFPQLEKPAGADTTWPSPYPKNLSVPLAVINAT